MRSFLLLLAPAALLVTVLAQSPEVPAPLRSFDRVVLLESKSETSASVSLGDIDGDGDLDIVLAKGRHWPLDNLILRNDGKGHFTTEVLGNAPDRTYSAALADLNGDGSLDIVVSNDHPDKKLVYFNDGKGHFRVGGAFGQPEWSTRYITVADLNGDGRPDIIVANRSSRPERPVTSFVCLNDGKGAFPVCNPLPTQSATIIVATDLDGDGFIDLIVPHRDGGRNLIFWNDGTGKFAATPTPFGPKQSSIRAAASADIDADGKKDIVVGDEKTGLFFYRGLGGRAFADPVALGTAKASPFSIAIADLNRDGKLDIVVGNFQAPGAIFFNRGNGKFDELPWNDGKGAVYGVAVGDLDGDGWPDIVAARTDAPNAIWYSRPARQPHRSSNEERQLAKEKRQIRAATKGARRAPSGADSRQDGIHPCADQPWNEDRRDERHLV